MTKQLHAMVLHLSRQISKLSCKPTHLCLLQQAVELVPPPPAAGHVHQPLQRSCRQGRQGKQGHMPHRASVPGLRWWLTHAVGICWSGQSNQIMLANSCRHSAM